MQDFATRRLSFRDRPGVMLVSSALDELKPASEAFTSQIAVFP